MGRLARLAVLADRAHRPGNVLGADEPHNQFSGAVDVAFGIFRNRLRRGVVAITLRGVGCQVDDEVRRRPVRRVGRELHPHRLELVRRPVRRGVPDETARSRLDLVADVARERHLQLRADRGVFVAGRSARHVRLNVRKHDGRLTERVRHVHPGLAPFDRRHDHVRDLRRGERPRRGAKKRQSGTQPPPRVNSFLDQGPTSILSRNRRCPKSDKQPFKGNVDSVAHPRCGFNPRGRPRASAPFPFAAFPLKTDGDMLSYCHDKRPAQTF